MRVLILFLSLSFSSYILACSQPITINYAPFVSLLVVEKFFGDFHLKLRKESGCEVKYSIQKNFDDFLIALFERKHTLAIVPGPYFNVLKQLNYSVVASQIIKGPRQIYLIAHKKSPLTGLGDLIGKDVFVNSPLSASGSSFLQHVDELNLLGHIHFDQRSFYDSMILSLLKGEGDAAVVIEEYWFSLNQVVRDSQLKIIEKLDAPASTEFIILKERVSLAPVIFDALQASFFKWGTGNKRAIGTPRLEALLQRKLQQYQQEQNAVKLN
ncbi:PhnD/SsuA/transferrin family substrate-binding protein [Pseudomonas sp. HK3]